MRMFRGRGVALKQRLRDRERLKASAVGGCGQTHRLRTVIASSGTKKIVVRVPNSKLGTRTEMKFPLKYH